MLPFRRRDLYAASPKVIRGSWLGVPPIAWVAMLGAAFCGTTNVDLHRARDASNQPTRAVKRPKGFVCLRRAPASSLRRVQESLYEHAGGDDALHRLEELFYAKALADPILNALFTKRVPTHVDHLTWFTAESFGGPDRFTSRLGFQHIIDVHRHLKITDEQRERFVALYLDALDEAALPDDEPFRQAVREHVEFGARVAQQNSCAETDADLHPIRAVPHWEWPN